MTPNEAKKDFAQRLAKAGVFYQKIKARTVSFTGFGYCDCLSLTIHKPTFPKGWKGLEASGVRAGIPKPSEGGYIICLD